MKRRGELANEIKQLDDAIAALNVVLGDERKPAPQRPPRSRVRPAIEHYLRDNRRVVHADEIVDSLKFQGVVLSSKDPKATVVTALIRMRDDNLVHALGANNYIWREYADDIIADAEEQAGEAEPNESGAARAPNPFSKEPA